MPRRRSIGRRSARRRSVRRSSVRRSSVRRRSVRKQTHDNKMRKLLHNCRDLKIYHTYDNIEVTVDGRRHNFPEKGDEYKKILKEIFAELPNTLTRFTYFTRFPDAVYYKGLKVPRSVRKLKLSLLAKIPKKNLGNPTKLYLSMMDDSEIKLLPNSVKDLSVELFTFKDEASEKRHLRSLRSKGIKVTIDDTDYE